MDRVGHLIRVAAQGITAYRQSTGLLSQGAGLRGLVHARNIVSTACSRSSGAVTPEDIEHSTGLERAELEGKAKGGDIFKEAWLDTPFGTIEKPVEVTSFFTERVVGVPDPDDDCHIVWGVIKEGEPPKQLVPDGEFFVLKRLTEIPAWCDDGH